MQEGADLVGREGDSFPDTYDVREKLGDGGTAQVWAAAHRVTGALVAVKKTSKQVGMRWSRAVRTFEHEAAMLEQCAHDHVIAVHGLYRAHVTWRRAGLVPEAMCSSCCSAMAR